MTVPAPGLLSAYEPGAKPSLKPCTSTRVTTSLKPPGGYGTTTRMPLAGYGCAIAPDIAAHSRSAPPQRTTFTITLLFLFLLAAARFPVGDLHQDIDGLAKGRRADRRQ